MLNRLTKIRFRKLLCETKRNPHNELIPKKKLKEKKNESKFESNFKLWQIDISGENCEIHLFFFLILFKMNNLFISKELNWTGLYFLFSFLLRFSFVILKAKKRRIYIPNKKKKHRKSSPTILFTIIGIFDPIHTHIHTPLYILTTTRTTIIIKIVTTSTATTKTNNHL